MLRSSLLSALTALVSVAAAGDVVVHYMAQTLFEDHASQDVQKALSLGVSAFALNIGVPDADWCKSAIEQLFQAAAGTEFKIFFSLDLYAKPDPYAFSELIEKYFTHPNYYTGGPNSAPVLSTFWDAQWGPEKWNPFLASLSSKPYFVPNFDQAPGYYNDPEGFWNAWSNTLDGSFSWEQAWPGNSDQHVDVTTEIDEKVMSVTHAKGKSYMMGLSSLQYKHFQGQHWFRAGDVALPKRMEQILSMADRPEFVQIQTWNDAGESHYIGHLWEEGLIPEILSYANQKDHSHEGWQPLVASFASAFKSGADASGMRPQNGQSVTGSMWHHEFLTTADCSSDPLGKPSGSGAALDTINWAVVINEDLKDHFVQVWSGGEMIAKDPLKPGLNYRAVPNVKTGEQHVQVVDKDGVVIAEGGKYTKGISQNAPGLCNFNFQVAELAAVESKRAEVPFDLPAPEDTEGDSEPTTTVTNQITMTTTIAVGTEPTTTVYETTTATTTLTVDGEGNGDEPTTTVTATTTMQTTVTGTPEPTTTVLATSFSTATVTVSPGEPTTTVLATSLSTATVTVDPTAVNASQAPAAGEPSSAPQQPVANQPKKGGRRRKGRKGGWRNRKQQGVQA
ncbi:glycoside hydrolase [Paramyrothecium foliicola]|nr:glycoside hydrolase [Paramyrothecium foliicola]